MIGVQTENLNGPLASVDDASESNLWKLMTTAKHLLDEPVSERDFQTGRLSALHHHGTNREALYRFTPRIPIQSDITCAILTRSEIGLVISSHSRVFSSSCRMLYNLTT